jgi:uncharacterized protein (DUF885 family)
MRGAGADIRDFHRKILENGVLPLDILEENFRKK